jgi:hypothetical protein
MEEHCANKLLDQVCDAIRQELLGQKDMKTTMVYTDACTERSEGILNWGAGPSQPLGFSNYQELTCAGIVIATFS